MAMGDKVTIEALNVENYGTWSIRMKALLIHKKLWKGVEDPSANPDESQSALAYITLYVKDHLLGTVGACETAKEAWNKLETTYKSKSNGRKLLLKRELDQLKKGPGESVSKYVARGENLYADLVATGFEMKKEELAFQLLVGLTSEYDMLVTALEARADVLTVEELLPLLLQTEARFKVQGETEREDGQAVAYAAKKGQPSKGFAQKRGNFEHKQKGSGSGSSNGVRCYRCGNAGHMVGECPVSRDIVCNTCGKSGHMRATCYQEHGPPKRPPWKGKGKFGGSSGNTGQSGGVAYTAYAEDPLANIWVLDLGSTQHLTEDRSKFWEMETLTTEKQIQFGNK
jgi:hypothetical protein